MLNRIGALIVRNKFERGTHKRGAHIRKGVLFGMGAQKLIVTAL